nr:hypothetical protein Q903MT_gene203 [Picea sitchensis]
MLDPPPRLVIAFLLALAHQMIIYNHQMTPWIAPPLTPPGFCLLAAIFPCRED